MKIKNKRALASGVIATAVGILALSAWLPEQATAFSWPQCCWPL